MPASQFTQNDDAALVKQAKSGNPQAFGSLYERYAMDIYRFIKAQIPDHLEAEDLTADVFLRAWHSLGRYRERGYPFSAYLYKIARNLLVDRWRNRKKEIVDSRVQFDVVADEAYTDHERFAPPPESQTIWRVLSEINETYRTVLVLRFMVGLCPGEIAVIMDRSEGAVRVLQHRALTAIRRQLAVDDVDDEN